MEKKKVLWTSRHELDPAAEVGLRNLFPENELEIKKAEILWSSSEEECYNLAVHLLEGYDCVCGVFPAQAVEAFRTCLMIDEASCFVPERVFSPVSVPETEPDQKKVRPFRFVRWAVLF